MIKGVQDFYYNVSDPQKSIQFYTGALQMKLVRQEPGWIALDCGGVQIGLHETEEGEMVEMVTGDSHGPHGGGCLTLKSDNIPEDRKRIEQAGGEILGEADAPWGHMLVFQDPDGNVLKLMKPKY